MARWVLQKAHYLNVPGTQWEHTEVARGNGKSKRMVYDVPMFLNPEDPNDWNHKTIDGGEIIVCHEGKGQRGDITFVGSPTADMEPLDDEAQAITDELSKTWVAPMSDEALPGQGYADRRMDEFLKAMEQIVAGKVPSMALAKQMEPVSVGGIDPDAFAKLQADFATLQKQHIELMAQVVGAKPAETDDEPLPIEPDAAPIPPVVTKPKPEAARRV